jgi:C-terminal processing protease CtpA/Prc
MPALGEPKSRALRKSSDLARILATAYVWGGLLLLSMWLLVGGGCGSSWKGSVGAVFGKDNRTGRVFVREVPADMAAARAGVQADDELLAIDGSPVVTMSAAEVHEKLAGDVGTKVTLKLRHPGSEPRDMVIERGPLRGEPTLAEKKQ